MAGDLLLLRCAWEILIRRGEVLRDREDKVSASPDSTMEAQSSKDPVEEWLLLWTALRRLECRDRAEAAIREFRAGRA